MVHQPDSGSTVRPFALIMKIERGHHTCSNHAPKKRIGQANLAVQIHRRASVVPNLIMPVPHASAEVFNAGDPGAAKQCFRCEANRECPYAVDQEGRCAACEGHGVMGPATVEKLQRRIAKRAEPKYLLHPSSPHGEYAREQTAINRAAIPPDVVIFCPQNH